MNTLRSFDFTPASPPLRFVEAADAVMQDGAVVLRNILSASLIEQLRKDLVAAMNEDLARFGHAHPFPGIVHALMTRGKAFIDLLAVDSIRALSRSILGTGALVHAYNSSSLPPRATNYAGRVHVDSPRLVPGYITNIGFTFPLDPFRRENGAMEIWPGSFHLATAPDMTLFDREKVVLDDLNPGDALCFNSRCWHQSGVNDTEAWRRAVTINVCRAYMRQQFDYPRMMPPELVRDLEEDVKQFLGYHVRMPVSLEEFLAPPDLRPYRPGQE